MEALGVILIVLGVVLVITTWTESTGQILGQLLGGNSNA